MAGNPQASVYIGNVDEKVDEKALYEIMIQAGPLVNLYMPRDKETNRHKGYAFAEFTTEKSAQYAVNLFSGLVYLHKKLLRFAISSQDKVAQSPPKDGTTKQSVRGLLDSSTQYPQKSHVPACSPPLGYNASLLGGITKGSVTAYPSVPVHSRFAGVGQRLDFSPLAHVQNFNAQLVSLGQAGRQSHLYNADRPLAYRLY
ncbi:hypothetical protein GOP47_0002636 [Adiantum capillus-veneris]|uniref:RRM domain-containing protein n=1 Tax=Adiantum capillus-veneris TaxID=13818 RepID=A0A9D4VC60_ADICA|nr:hypothetical protein GOP47_0002636 [Adiantum capillus-veneris]